MSLSVNFGVNERVSHNQNELWIASTPPRKQSCSSGLQLAPSGALWAAASMRLDPPAALWAPTWTAQ